MDYATKVSAMIKAMKPTFWELAWAYLTFNKSVFVVEDWKKYYVPILYIGPYSKDVVEKFMNGQTVIEGASHVREGVVIKPLIEEWNQKIGRLILKAVSPDYLERA